MAIEDKNSEHGLQLTIEDYPYANDGLLIWDAIKKWVTEYVNHYYSSSAEVEGDEELQAWWTEIRTVGHGDKKDAPGWPDLKTRQSLIDTVTNMAWMASGHHAAVNFGQYAYAGYFPNRPSNARTKMPTEDKDPNVWKAFKENPEDTLLKCFPTQFQAGLAIAILDVLSTHSPDEEYLGKEIETAWRSDPVIVEAFNRFKGRMEEIERIIDEKNANEDLRNRHGAGILAYELLKPFSGPGVTNKGIPYSISI